MREGDIYSWRWKCDDKHADGAPYRSYHCKSRIAVFDGKSLFDTFWSRPTDGSWLNQDQVLLTLLGNKNDMTILKDRPEFYSPDDLVSMKHSNNSGAPIYLKDGAARNVDVMRDVLHQKKLEAERKVRSAIRDLELLAVASDRLETGDIAKLYF